jgi:hypothetical protein
MIINYNNFLLLESILVVDPEFETIIKNIQTKDPVAGILRGLFGQDIKTNLNYLKPSDKNDQIKFVNDSQVGRMKDVGTDPFTRASNLASIGRSVKQILISNGISVSDSQVEDFVNSYKTAWAKMYEKTGGFRLVKGDEIKSWYLVDNYVPGGGTLNSSCMRYESCQDFFSIYTENPDVCQLLILTDDRDLLLGRALLWKLVEGSGISKYFLDRIYTRYDNDHDLFIEWFENFIQSKDYSSYHNGKTTGCQVQLKNWKFKEYPYMDTFWILDVESESLMSFDGRNSSKFQYIIQSTSGDVDVPNHMWSDYLGDYIHRSEAIWINYKNDYVRKEDIVTSYKNENLIKDDAIWSDYYKSYLLKENAVNLPEFGIVDVEDVVEVWDEVEGGIPKKFLESKIEESDYRLINYRNRDIYLNKKHLVKDVHLNEWFYNSESLMKNKKKLYLITDEEFQQIDSKMKSNVNTVFSLYSHLYTGDKMMGLNSKFTFIPLIYRFLKEKLNYALFCTDIVLEMFDLEIDGRELFVMPMSMYKLSFVKVIPEQMHKMLGDLSNPAADKLAEEISVFIDYLKDLGIYKTNMESWEKSKT